MPTGGGVQFVVGGVLEGEQGVAGITGKPAAARWIVESVMVVIRNAGWKRCCGCRCFPPGRTPTPASA
jgi:hypothetical protein